jgi:hypothetical protein
MPTLSLVSPSPFNEKLAPLICKALPLFSVGFDNSVRRMDITPAIWLSHILPYLDLEFDFKTGRALSLIADADLRNYIQAYLSEIQLKKLLQHLVYENYEGAERMIRMNPSLLLRRGIIEDYSYGMNAKNHRKISGKAYQVALICGDVSILKRNDRMPEMVRNHLLTLPNGKLELKNQLEEHFSAEKTLAIEQYSKQTLRMINRINTVILRASEADCEKAINIELMIRNILNAQGAESDSCSALTKIIHTIASAACENEFNVSFAALASFLLSNNLIDSADANLKVLKAIYRLRNFLEPRQIVATEVYSSISLLLHALDFYAKLKPSPRNRQHIFLYWRLVIGYMQRFVPKWYEILQAQGLMDVNGNRSTLRGSDQRFGEFPLDLKPDYLLGCHYAHGSFGGVAISGGNDEIRTSSLAIKKIYRKKLSSIAAHSNAPDLHENDTQIFKRAKIKFKALSIFLRSKGEIEISHSIDNLLKEIRVYQSSLTLSERSSSMIFLTSILKKSFDTVSTCIDDSFSVQFKRDKLQEYKKIIESYKFGPRNKRQMIFGAMSILLGTMVLAYCAINMTLPIAFGFSFLYFYSGHGMFKQGLQKRPSAAATRLTSDIVRGGYISRNNMVP